MVRCLGIVTLCLAISVSVRYGVPEPKPKCVPLPDGSQEVAVPQKKEANQNGEVLLPKDNEGRVEIWPNHSAQRFVNP
jgi:hypothetical protein